MILEKENEDKETPEEAQVSPQKNEAETGCGKSSAGASGDGIEKIQKDVLVAELVKKHPELVEPLMMMGMHCISCFASQLETLEEAAMVHGLNPDDVVEDLNQFLADEKSGGAGAEPERTSC